MFFVGFLARFIVLLDIDGAERSIEGGFGFYVYGRVGWTAGSVDFFLLQLVAMYCAVRVDEAVFANVSTEFAWINKKSAEYSRLRVIKSQT